MVTNVPDIDAGIDKWSLFNKLEYTPHSIGQKDFHFSKTRFRVPCCGRRWGKSLSAGKEMTAALFEPDAYYWICGPEYRLGEKEFRVVLHDLDTLGIRKHLRVSNNVKQGDMRIEMPWKTILEVTSATRPDSLLGEGLDGMILSEAARHSMETWQMYLEPALSDKRGWAIFPSTPRGFNWYNGLWNLGQYGNHTEYESWRFPSWTNKVKFPGGYDDPEMVRIRSLVSKSYWLQEYAAEFTTFEGQIYDEFNVQYHVKDIKYNPAWKNYWAIDFGFADPFVCLDIMVDPADNVYVWREYQKTSVTTWDHGHILKKRVNPLNFHLDGIFADPRGADEIATLAPIIGSISANSALVGWITGIEEVKRWLKLQPNGDPKLFIDPSCHELIRQMQSLRKKNSKEGQNIKEGQHDFDDHGPDALRYFFAEYFVLGAGSHLADVYDAPPRLSESETFFKLAQGFNLDEF